MDNQNENFEETLGILGLNSVALRGKSKKELKKTFKAAYRREIKKNHPDTIKSQGGTENEAEREEKTRKIIETYEMITQAVEIPVGFETISRWINEHSEPTIEENEATKEVKNEYLLDGITIQLPKIGFAGSTFNGKDIYEALVKFYSGDEVDEINDWLREQKHTEAWKLARIVDNQGKETGIPRILIDPHRFDWRNPVEIGKVVDWLTKREEYKDVQPGEYVDVRHYYEDYRGRLTNVRISNFLRPEELGNFLDATEHLAQYTVYDGEIPSLWQSYTRNVFLGLENNKRRELGYRFSSDFEPFTIPLQRGKEGQTMWRREQPQAPVAMLERPRTSASPEG